MIGSRLRLPGVCWGIPTQNQVFVNFFTRFWFRHGWQQSAAKPRDTLLSDPLILGDTRLLFPQQCFRFSAHSTLFL